MKYHKALPLNEAEVEALKGQLLIAEIRRLTDELEELLHMNKYYKRELNPETLARLHLKLIRTTRDFI